MCDNCECEPQYNDDGTAMVAECTLVECKYLGYEKKCIPCEDCSDLCQCECHIDWQADYYERKIDMAMEV